MNRPRSCDGSRSSVGRARSTFSVSSVDCYLNLPVTSPPSPAVSSITLTPGRIRNIDQDMENLRVSRQDNPFIQQVLASRESLIDSLTTEEESDDANLMSKELSLDLEVDPFSLPDIHEHMIRSPPPVNWPKSPNYRVFDFGNDDETISVEVNAKDSKTMDLKPKHSSWDRTDTSPLKSFCKSHHYQQDRFALLTPSTLRSPTEDSVRLMAED